jgi:hypothetical protein
MQDSVDFGGFSLPYRGLKHYCSSERDLISIACCEEYQGIWIITQMNTAWEIKTGIVANENEISPDEYKIKPAHLASIFSTTTMPPNRISSQGRLAGITTCMAVTAQTLEILASTAKTPFMEAISNTTQSLLKNIQVTMN